jgi:hypothetical protein
VFSSLDRIDIVLKEVEGRKQFVQTDHRTAGEVEEEPELSVLFALIRILNPKRMAEPGTPEPVVMYAARERPPEFLRKAIRAAGGLITLGPGTQPEPDEGDTPPLDEVIQSAFLNMARAVAAEYRVRLTPAGLAAVERALAGSAGDPEGDEIGYWSAVVKLGSFGGEVIRASNGGRWLVVATGSLPFALSTRFRGEEATVNPLGKAIKRFAHGEEDSVLSLVNLIRSQP